MQKPKGGNEPGVLADQEEVDVAKTASGAGGRRGAKCAGRGQLMKVMGRCLDFIQSP